MSILKKTSVVCLLAATLPLSLQANDPFAEMDEAFSTQKTYDPGSSDFQKEFEAFKRQERTEFKSYKEQLEAEFKEYKKIYAEEQGKYTAQIKNVWDDAVTSSKKVWVEYSDNYHERRSVDFEKKTISLAFSDLDKEVNKSVRKSLKEMIKKDKAQAFKDDVVAQAVEKRSKESMETLVTADVKPEPILAPLVSDKPTLTDSEIDAIVDRMIKSQVKKESIDKKGKKVVTVQVPLEIVETAKKKEEKASVGKVKKMADLRLNSLPKSARNINEDVQTFASKANIDPSLVFAVIETESAFNPMAKSPVPAYGLMQIVPASAGQDATQKLFGQAKILSPSYLYNSTKNIEIGTTYLNILYYRYLKRITNEESRLYCSIAAYNTGAGNVAKAFTGKLKLRAAIKKINELSPQEVYDHLVENLPYDETRKYLVKVKKRISKYKVSQQG